MKQEDIELLIKDLCAKHPHGVKVLYNGTIKEIQYIEPAYNEVKLLEDFSNYTVGICEVKPYLRSLSSMTDEEYKEWQHYKNAIVESCDERLEERISELHDWFDANKFDYRGLIPKGLAIEVTKENNPYKE